MSWLKKPLLIIACENEEKTKKDKVGKTESRWGGSVGRVVASYTRDPQFESSHWHLYRSLFIVNY